MVRGGMEGAKNKSVASCHEKSVGKRDIERRRQAVRRRETSKWKM